MKSVNSKDDGINDSIGCKKGLIKDRKTVQNNVVGKLSCFYVNARSIVNKRDELELYVLEEKPDLIGITETWATNSIEDAELNLDGYTMLRKDRILGNKLRGVVFYYK